MWVRMDTHARSGTFARAANKIDKTEAGDAMMLHHAGPQPRRGMRIHARDPPEMSENG